MASTTRSPSIPILTDIYYLFIDDKAAFDYLIHNNVLKIPLNCPECSSGMSPKTDKYYMYRCKRKNCRKSMSIFKNTFFNRSRLTPSKILHITYLWLTKSSTETIRIQTGISSDTACNWLNYLHQLVSWDIENLQSESKIGGNDVIVEIDESKFGKRKNNRGHHIEGVCVVGGVERTPEKKLFSVTVPNRDAKTLANIIENNVLPRSIVYTDCWKGYRDEDLQEIGITHETVNHSITFVDPVTGVHTNTIEGTWKGIKLRVPPKHRTQQFMKGELMEFIWRRNHEHELWNRILFAMSEIIYIEDEDDNEEPKQEEIEEISNFLDSIQLK